MISEVKAKEKKDKLKKFQYKKNIARELAILNFMLKNDVLFHHHGVKDSCETKIKVRIDWLKKDNIFQEYDSYIWNYQGDGKNYMPLSWLGFIFNSVDFNSIYDVPLDGSHEFYAYDSGMRGLGSFSYITAVKINKVIEVPKVNPGGFPPTTC